MWAYEQAYGFTQLRLLVSVCELWLGVVFVLVLAAGVRLRTTATWLPRTVLATAVAALIGICALNPDGFIAERNVIRYTKTNQVDLGYLGQLSADAVAALDRLPEPLRTCALERIHSDLVRSGPDEWRQWNLGRYWARDLLANYRAPDAAAWRACTAATRASGS
jgi:hypothetical protein